MSVFGFLILVSLAATALGLWFFMQFRPGHWPWEVWGLIVLGVIGMAAAMVTREWHERWLRRR